MILKNFFSQRHKDHKEGQKIIPAGGQPFKKVAKHAFWDDSNVRCRDASKGTTHRAPTLRAMISLVCSLCLLEMPAFWLWQCRTVLFNDQRVRLNK